MFEFLHKDRELAQQLAEELGEVRQQLEIERAKRISAEAITTERKAELDRVYQMLAQAEAARDKSLQYLDSVNGKLLQVMTPEKQMEFRKPVAQDGVTPLVQMRTARPRPNPADALYMAMLSKQRDVLDKAKASKLSEATQTTGLPVS